MGGECGEERKIMSGKNKVVDEGRKELRKLKKGVLSLNSALDLSLTN